MVCLCMLLGNVCPAVEEPNDIVGACSFASGATTADPNSGCPSWDMVLDRHSTDTYKETHLIVELDACQIITYDVNSIPQGTSTPVSIDVQCDDLVIVWDEDFPHGESPEHKGFTFTDQWGQEDPDGFAADPNCPYVRVSRADDPQEVLNWMIYRMMENGTVTITNTGLNEHDVIRLYRNQIYFDKVDDVNDLDCRGLNQEIVYTICFENAGLYSFEDAYIIDWLPDGVTYQGEGWTFIFDPNLILIPPDPAYQAGTHAYIWDLGTISPGDANCVTLTVTVNKAAEPGLYLHNVAELIAGDTVIARAFEDTLVCCWGDPNVIYVDSTADGYNSGTSWENAYTDLADSLYRAANSICSGPYTIYVAAGRYAPQDTENGFVVPEGTECYGGFKSGGCDFSECNPKKYKTTLAGLINEQSITFEVVTMGNGTLLDGFTVTNAFEQAVYGNGVDFTVSHCIIQETFGHGIYAKNGDVSVQWCNVKLNDVDGIRHEGAGHSLTINNSWILRNGECGIRCENSTPHVYNSIVSESDLTRQGRAGIRLQNPSSEPVLYNLTISNNREVGIYFADDRTINDPNEKDWPDVQNCIVYYNNGGGRQLSSGLDADRVANFCCIQDCNSVPLTTNYNNEPGFAYVIDPNGAPDPNNYHLAYNAFCVDKGNDMDLDYTGQVDIDGEGEDRQYGEAVDIGADEVYDCGDDILTDIDVHNDLDWDADGLVNINEFSKFAKAWLSYDPNHPSRPSDPNVCVNWNSACDLVEDLHIDLADFEVFLDNWLWVACWKLEDITQTMMLSGDGESMMMQPLSMMTMDAEIIDSEPEVSLYTLVQIIGFLNELVAENPDNIENIQELRAYLMNQIWEIWSRQNE